ncbi:MAG TPA: hypothetical protein PK858_01180 [Saprospiraceae bacterium]|nr:hypothetical protein [Saprospiraceae bacterium]
MAIIPALLLALAVNLTAQEVENPTFAQFVAQFPQASLPYTLDAQALIAKPAAKAKRLDWQFYQFLPELERAAQVSNMPVYPEPVAAFETKEYVAVLYNVARGINRNNVSAYTVSVFDRDGNYISTHRVAGSNGKALTIATINEQLKAIQQVQPIQEGGFENDAVQPLQLDLLTPTQMEEADWSAVTTKSF